MSSNVIKTRIFQRRDTESSWNQVNPVLSSGEIVFSETSSGTFMKYGDGRNYNDTPFWQATRIDDRLVSAFSLVHISQEDYDKLVVSGLVDQDTLYIVSSDVIDAKGQQIKNLADGTEVSDAINLGQLNAAISSIVVPADLSSFSNSPGYITKASADIDYQPRGEYLSSNALSGYKTYAAALSSLSSDGYATSADVTLTERGPNKDGFSEWTFSPSSLEGGTFWLDFYSDELIGDNWFLYWTNADGSDTIVAFRQTGRDSTNLSFELGNYAPLPSELDLHYGETITATREPLQGYILGSQTSKPLPTLAMVTNNAAAIAVKADKSEVAQVAQSATNYTDSVATDIKAWTTNSTIVGYTSWTYSGDTSPTAVYSINMTESGGSYLFSLYDTVGSTLIGTVTTNVLNPTVLVYSLNPGTITASRDPIRRNTNGFAMYSDVQEVKDDIRDMDTSYYRFNHITNVNQSVQYVYTDANTTQLNIAMPESGMTKDWLVYVLAETNLNIKLPAATYWVSSDSVTNAIPPATPTALYFTQITDDTYSIGRKEFVPITVETPMAATLRKAREKATRGGSLRYANTALTARKPAAATKTAAATAAKTATATKPATVSTNKVQSATKK